MAGQQHTHRCTDFASVKGNYGAGETALQAEVPATRPDDLSDDQEPTWWKGKTDSRDLSSDLRMGMV